MAAVKARSSRRDVNLAATRAHTLQSARRLFLEKGYLGTTIEAVAREAGVAVQTVYNAVGNKAALLAGVFEDTVSGPEAPRPAPAFLQERSEAVADVGGIVRLLGAWFVEVHARMAPVWKLLEEAAAHDEGLAAFARKRAHQRLRNYELAAAQIQKRGGLAGMTLEEAAALIWTVGHPLVYRTLVLEQRWPAERYRRWVEKALRAALVPARRGGRT